jgi:hypothetical protein
MKRLMILLGVVCLVFVFEAIDPAFARYNDTGSGGFSLWHILVGGFLLVVLFGVFAGGEKKEKETEEEKSKRVKKAKERQEIEKKEKGLLRYYGEPIGSFFLPSLFILALPLVLGFLFWLFD